MAFDAPSYVMGNDSSFKKGREVGRQEGRKVVVLESDAYDFTDANHDGHVVISKTEVNDG